MSTQTWFITGASSGLGASVANAALRAGHRVAVTARDKVRLEKLTEAHPDAVLPLSMDLTKPSEIKTAITTAEKWHGGIDVLVNNAALGYLAAIEEGEEQNIRTLFDTNVFGVPAPPGFHCERRRITGKPGVTTDRTAFRISTAKRERSTSVEPP